MILINLLPHREAARKKRREIFFIALGVAAVLGGLISGGIYSWYASQIDSQKEKNNFLKNEITQLDNQIKDIATLQAEISALRARQAAVEDLQGDRNLPVYLLSELVKQLPDGIYINSMKHENQSVLITGVAQSNERVSELLRNFGSGSPWLIKPELVEITSGTLALTARDQRRVSNFSMRVGLQRPAAVKAAAASAAKKTVPEIGTIPKTAVIPASNPIIKQ